MNPAQLAALVAIADHGTFDAAARHLHVTPSAISQRIRALESAAGQVLIRRSTPCTPTPAGQTLLRLARQSALLFEEARAALDERAGTRTDLPIAVNADSLATWFRSVLGELAGWDDVSVRLHVEDQAFSAGLLRAGDVLGAVTSDPVAVQGCTVRKIGTMRYSPAATPALVERWRRGREPDWARMPVVVFNEKDALQHEVLEGLGVGTPEVVHRVPTSADFLAAVRLGLGWGMLPEIQLEPGRADDTLVRLAPRRAVDVPLYWQRWRLDSPVLTRLSDAVDRAAARHLRHRATGQARGAMAEMSS